MKSIYTYLNENINGDTNILNAKLSYNKNLLKFVDENNNIYEYDSIKNDGKNIYINIISTNK